jgi:hypothetical protein
MVLVNPNNIFQIGFQLSFLSVISIISSIDYYVTNLRNDNVIFYTKFGKIMNFIILNSIISITAELANTPITIYNFNNYTFYNVITNIIVGPLISFIILPFSLTSLILYFIGLEFILIIPATYAVDIVLMVSDYVLSIKDAISFLPSPCYSSMFFMIFGIVFLSVCKSNLKHFGILFYFVGIFLFITQKTPDIIFDRVDKSIYFINEKKKIFVYNPNFYTVNNIVKKIGGSEYSDITEIYKKEKYLIFYKNSNELKINLKNFNYEMVVGDVEADSNNDLLSLYMKN